MVVVAVWIFFTGRLVRSSALCQHGHFFNPVDIPIGNRTFNSSLQIVSCRISYRQNSQEILSLLHHFHLCSKFA